MRIVFAAPQTPGANLRSAWLRCIRNGPHSRPRSGSSTRSARIGVALALVLALAGCGGYGGARFTGPVTPQGSGAACGSATRGVLVLGEKDFTFAPNEGVVLLRGTVQRTGDDSAKLHGTYQTTGADKKPYAESFDGTLKGNAISGTWTKPGCTASVTLKAD